MVVLRATTNSDCLLWFDTLVLYSTYYDVRCIQSLLVNLNDGFVSHSEAAQQSLVHI